MNRRHPRFQKLEAIEKLPDKDCADCKGQGFTGKKFGLLLKCPCTIAGWRDVTDERCCLDAEEVRHEAS